MDTATAAQTAGVTVATIRTWCRRNVIAAVKTAGRWVIDAASLAYRITLGVKDEPVTLLPDLTDEFIGVVCDTAAHAADRYNRAALDKLLADVKARSVQAIMGDGVATEQVQMDDAAWYRLAIAVSAQRGCVAADDYL